MDHKLSNVSTTAPDTAIDCKDVPAPTELAFLTFSLSLLFFFVVVSGNLLVIFAIFKDPYHELKKKPFILLVGNLACADLIVGLVVTPISVVLHFMEGLGEAILHISWVKLLHLSYFISCTASLLSMAFITIDRHIAIAYPLRYKSNAISKRPRVIFVLIWVFAVGLSLVYFEVGYIRYAFVFGNIAICVTVSFLISCVYVLRRISGNLTPAGTRGSNRSERNVRAEKHVTKVFTLVLVAYLLCYFPSCLIIYVMNFCTSCSCEVIHWLRDMQFVLVLLNSCLNPILYSWQMKAFRSAFKSLLCRSFENVHLNSSLSSQLPSTFSNEPSILKRTTLNSEVQKSCQNVEDPIEKIELDELSLNSFSRTSPRTNKNIMLSFEQKVDLE